MIVCGVEIKSKEAILVLVEENATSIDHIICQTKRLKLGDHKKCDSINDMLDTIKAFAHDNNVDRFVIKSRALAGMRAASGVTFKIEALFQLSGKAIEFVSPPTLAKFAKTNLGGLPSTVLVYQQDAYRVGAYALANN